MARGGGTDSAGVSHTPPAAAQTVQQPPAGGLSARNWIGGHGRDPYEQNTQQSPALGRSTAPQPAQS